MPHIIAAKKKRFLISAAGAVSAVRLSGAAQATLIIAGGTLLVNGSIFGMTSLIFLQDLSRGGAALDTLSVPTNQVVISFPSKSEIGINLCPT